jgi:hypothetical protein
MMGRNPEFGAIMDVMVWLRSLGLGKYEAAFRENDIDETVLPDLGLESARPRAASVNWPMTLVSKPWLSVTALQCLALRCNGTVTRFSQARVVDVEISHRLVDPDEPNLLADDCRLRALDWAKSPSRRPKSLS